MLLVLRLQKCHYRDLIQPQTKGKWYGPQFPH